MSSARGNGALQEVARLGDGEVFVYRRKNGAIKAVRAQMVLSQELQEIACIQGKGKEKVMTTAKGFLRANSIASLSIVTPPKLQLPNGEIVVNPYPIIDPGSGTIKKVWVKKQAVGYSPIGVLTVSTATLLYDLNIYFIEDLIRRVSKNKLMGRLCHRENVTEEELKEGIFLQANEFFGVYVKFQWPDTMEAMKNHMRKTVFAERNAQSIAERLALSKHPALAHIVYPQAYQDPAGNCFARVTITGFVHDLSREEILEAAQKAEEEESFEVRGEKVEVVPETVETATAEEIVIEVDAEEEQSAREDELADEEESLGEMPDDAMEAPPSLFDVPEGRKL